MNIDANPSTIKSLMQNESKNAACLDPHDAIDHIDHGLSIIVSNLPQTRGFQTEMVNA